MGNPHFKEDCLKNIFKKIPEDDATYKQIRDMHARFL